MRKTFMPLPGLTLLALLPALAAAQTFDLTGLWKSNTAVELSTVWDTSRDAEEFAASMNEWIDQGDGSARVLEPEGKAVRVLFASDQATLDALEAAAA